MKLVLRLTLLVFFAPAIAVAKQDLGAFKVHYQNGIASLKDGKLIEARKELETARLDNPKSSATVYELGLLAQRQARIKDARTNFKICLKLDPKNIDCKTQLARLGRPAKTVR